MRSKPCWREKKKKRAEKKQAPKRKVLDLTALQVVASALATVVGAVLASLPGVTGTIIGAAVVRTSATTGAAVFPHAFRRTGEGIRRRVPAVALVLTPTEERAIQRADARAAFALLDETPTTTPSESESVTTYRTGSFWKSVGWKKYMLATGLVFALAMVAVTAGELIMGKPIAAAVRGESGRGTSMGGGSAGTPAPTHGATPTPLASSGAGITDGQPGLAVPRARSRTRAPALSTSTGAGQSAGSSPRTSASTVPSASGGAVNSPDTTAR
ncbi:hypothetical protein ACRAWF_36235 [Streptomyces sp. L7]